MTQISHRPKIIFGVSYTSTVQSMMYHFIIQQHYVVREVKIEAYCHCNGHADGINCPYNEATKDRECVCQEGTCGVQCGYCCPAYNQYPFQIGQLGPFTTDKERACESKSFVTRTGLID
jgi:hypothetical protein